MLQRRGLLAATNSVSGFGTKYADPTTALPTGGLYDGATDVKFSPSGAFIGIAHGISPYISVYSWSYISGFGTKVANPTFIPSGSSAYGYGFRFSPNENSISYGYRRSPYIVTYAWSSSGFGSYYTAPSTLPIGDGKDVSFSPQEDVIAVGGYSGYSTIVGISIYRWSSATGYGTKYSDPASFSQVAGASMNGVTFSPAGDAFIAGGTSGATPLLNAYPWSYSLGLGTRYTNPSTMPVGGINRVRFSPNGDYVAIAHDTAPRISIYPWSAASGFGTKYSDPATAVTSGFSADVTFSSSGDVIAIAGGSTPFVNVYKWSSSGFGFKYTNPSVLPAGSCTGVDFSPSNNVIALSSSTAPYICAYQWYT